MGASTSKKYYILIVGPEQSGKTTFLYGNRLRQGWEKYAMEPTLGYNYEEFSEDSRVLCFFDTPGSEYLFPVISNLYENIRFAVIIFVIAISDDPSYYIQARRLLKFYCAERCLKSCILYVVVNDGMSNIENSEFQTPEYFETVLDLKNLNIKEGDYKIRKYNVKSQPKGSEKIHKWIIKNIKNKEKSKLK